MLKTSSKIVLVAVGTAIAFPIFAVKPSLSQTPSLGDGIMCVARGKTDKRMKKMFKAIALVMLGHKNMQYPVRYTELAASCFKEF